METINNSNIKIIPFPFMFYSMRGPRVSYTISSPGT